MRAFPQGRVAGSQGLGASHLKWMHHIFTKLFIGAHNFVVGDV